MYQSPKFDFFFFFFLGRTCILYSKKIPNLHILSLIRVGQTEWQNEWQTDRRTIKGRSSGDCGWRNRALATKRSPTARAARASPKCTKSPNLIFFLGISTQKLYQSTKILGQSTKILCQNTKIMYQIFFYKSYVPKSQIWFFFFGKNLHIV